MPKKHKGSTSGRILSSSNPFFVYLVVEGKQNSACAFDVALVMDGGSETKLMTV